MPRPEGGFVGSPTLRPTPLTACTSALMRECPSPARPGISPPSSGLAPPKVAPRLLGATAPADAPPRELGSYGLALPPTLTDAGTTCGTRDINPSINLANCRLLLEADSSVTASSESAVDGAALALVAFSAQGWHAEGAAVAGDAAESAVTCVLPAAGAFGPLAPVTALGLKRTREQRSPLKSAVPGEQPMADGDACSVGFDAAEGVVEGGFEGDRADVADQAAGARNGAREQWPYASRVRALSDGAPSAVASAVSGAKRGTSVSTLQVLAGRVAAPRAGPGLPARARQHDSTPTTCFFTRLGRDQRIAFAFHNASPAAPRQPPPPPTQRQRLRHLAGKAAGRIAVADPLDASKLTITPCVGPPSRVLASAGLVLEPTLDVAARLTAVLGGEGALAGKGAISAVGPRTESPVGPLPIGLPVSSGNNRCRSSSSEEGEEGASLAGSSLPSPVDVSPVGILPGGFPSLSFGSCLTDSRSASAASNAPTIVAAMDDE